MYKSQQFYFQWLKDFVLYINSLFLVSTSEWLLEIIRFVTNLECKTNFVQ